MNNRTKLFAAGAAAALAGLANAQVDYSYNVQTHNRGFLGGIGFIDGPNLFGSLSGDGHYATTGDAIRICYGIDRTQGGRNQEGNSAVTWFQVVGSFPVTNTVQDLEIGLVSFAASSVDSLDGDACFNPFFAQGDDSVTGAPINIQSTTSFAFVPGYLTVPPTPFPTFWFVYFQFLGTTGLLTRNTLGTEPAGVGSFVDPLLTNLIFEVQGPQNFGPLANNYFLAATSESIGLGSGGTGTGGVTNGNARQGQGGSAMTADLSGAVSNHRLFALDQSGSGLTTGTYGINFGGGAGTVEWFGGVATHTPSLWAAKDGNMGAGSTDLSIGNSVSTLQWVINDHLAGGEGTALSGSPATGVTNPNLGANLAIGLYSRTAALGMLQEPMSWDTVGGLLAGAPGSIVIGPQGTSRAGIQTVPVNFDNLLNNFLVGQPAFTFGGNYTGSADNNVDGVFDSLFAWGGNMDIGVGSFGQSFMPAALPISAAPNPALVGRKVGLAGVGIQFDVVVNALGVTEFTNGMTLNLQP